MRPWCGVVAAAVGVALLTHVGVAAELHWSQVPGGLLLLGCGIYEIRRADALPLRETPLPVNTVRPQQWSDSRAVPAALVECDERAQHGEKHGLRFVEVTELPRPEPNVSWPATFGGARLHVIYERIWRDDPNEELFAVVEFEDGRLLDRDSFDDDQLFGHPWYPFGLMPYRIQEVIGAGERRHFVFALKDGSCECTASGYRLVGEFPSYDEAEAAVRELRTPER